MRNLRQERAPLVAAGLDEKAMLGPVEKLGQGDVEPLLNARTRAHRNAEARASRLAAIDGHDQRAFAQGLVMRVNVHVADENPVLDLDRANFTRPHADKGETIGRRRFGRNAGVRAIAFGRPKSQLRRMQMLLPGLRPDGITKERLVIATGQSVAAAVLLIRHPAGQIVDGFDIVVNDRLILHGGADGAIAARPDRPQQGLQALDRDVVAASSALAMSAPNPASCPPISNRTTPDVSSSLAFAGALVTRG